MHYYTIRHNLQQPSSSIVFKNLTNTQALDQNILRPGATVLTDYLLGLHSGGVTIYWRYSLFWLLFLELNKLIDKINFFY